MNKIIFASAAALFAALSTTASAFAWERPPIGSDDNLRYSRAYVEQAVDMLSHDQSDYDGHRAAAMNDIQAAREDLSVALQYDRNHEDQMLPNVGLSGVASQDWTRGQYRSNENLEYTRQYVEKAIDMLQHDQHDYDGYRVRAIGELQQARGQLLAALQSR
jgi:opacity protein-like surface antigen